MSDALRLLRTPRWVTLTTLALIAIVAFGFLSHWQWDRANQDQDSALAAADPPPVAIASILSTGPLDPQAYGRRVSVTGTYDAAGQRTVERGTQRWVLTPLAPADGGPAVAVVRGWVESGAAPAPPTGPVTVTGRVQPYDGDPGVQPGDTDLPAGELPRLTASTVAPLVTGPIGGGWVALSEQTPASTLPTVTGPASPEASGGLRWQNASYAVQWVLFAGFAAFLWWRWFRDDLAESRAAADDPQVVV